MRLLLPLALSLLAAGPAQAAAYRCKDAAGATVFQDQPCSAGPSVKLRAAPPAPESPRALTVEPGGEALEKAEAAADVEAAESPQGPGHDNVREYLDAREREREQLRGEQRRAFAGEEARQRRSNALAKIDERLRVLSLQKASLAADTEARSRAIYEERMLQRLRARVDAGAPGAVEEAGALR